MKSIQDVFSLSQRAPGLLAFVRYHHFPLDLPSMTYF